MKIDGKSLDGPRAARRRELAQMVELINHVFRPDGKENMYELFPLLFADDNLGNCRIILDGGRPVSHAAYVPRAAVIGGPTVGVACIGSVCTHEDYRGHRLASAILDDCEKRMRGQGVDVAIISGGRGLYLRRGARTAGRLFRYEVNRETAPRLAGAPMKLRPAGPQDIPALAELYDSYPVHFSRPAADWEKAMTCDRHEGALRRPQIGWVDGKPVAYILTDLRKEGILAAEWGGVPDDIIRMLAALARQSEQGAVEMFADPAADLDMIRLLDDAGIDHTVTQHGRTVKVLRPRALFEKLRPHLAAPACDITVSDMSEGARFELGGNALELAVEELARAFFGDPENELPRRLESAGGLGRAMLENFPFPLTRYGYNFA